MLKRIFDCVSALCALLVLLPFLSIIGICIALESKGGIFFYQTRIGKNKIPFKLIKFRSMRVASESKGQLTVGNLDPRITKMGRFVRKFKIDEFPQLVNVLKGDMSIVGPRPEVPRYVKLYSEKQLNVLTVQPGLTDYASIIYFDEDRLLGESDNPEQTYISDIMPAKLELNLKYIRDKSLKTDLKIIFKTIGKIFH